MYIFIWSFTTYLVTPCHQITYLLNYKNLLTYLSNELLLLNNALLEDQLVSLYIIFMFHS
jgi:hypothetical protein